MTNKKIIGKRSMAEAQNLMESLGIVETKIYEHSFSSLRLKVSESEFDRVMANRGVIVASFREIGYKHIAIDLET